MSSLLQNPSDIELMRSRLFSIQEDLVFSPEQHTLYWPYITNVWSLNLQRPRTATGSQVSYYWCRMWRKEQRKTQGKGERKKDMRMVNPCAMKLKVTKYFDSDTDTISYYHLQRHGDCTEHNHDLDSMDALKRNQKLKNVAGEQMSHGYAAAAINKTLKAYNRPDAEAALIAAGGQHMNRQDIVNSGLEWKKANPDDRLVQSRYGWEDQWAELADWLESEKYLTQNITATRQIDGKISHGTVFAAQHRVDVLRYRGHLTLMDSTHDSNWLGWYLYTMAVRDESGSWRPCVHLLAEYEDGDILSEAFRVIKRWCGGQGGWRLRYMLTDDSSSEQRAVKLAFRGLIDGETEVTHLLCVFHSEQTLKRRLGGPRCKRSYACLRAALRYRKTRFGCEESIQQAIDYAPEDKKNYIYNEWYKTREQWAHTYRTHSPLLLQIPTTSPIEGYHSALKNKEGKAILQRFSLLGIAKHSCMIDKEFDQRAQHAAVKFRSRILPQVAEYPFLYKLPTPVQVLLADEIKAAQNLIEEGEEPKELGEESSCECQFFQKYQLPCRDIWYQHILFGILNEEDFERWSFMWEESGFELYEGITSEYYHRGIDEEIGAPVRRRLDMRETLDSLKSRYYALEEQVAGYPPEKADAVMKWWNAKLERATGPLRSIGATEWTQEIGIAPAPEPEAEDHGGVAGKF